MPGILSLCATPIGNLEDITLRVIRTLKEADCVYAEDTRRTLGLLNHLDIKKPLHSCHEHNEALRVAEITEKVLQGQKVVYVSDAGMPGISDPGSVLVRACIEGGVPFEVLPGASALPLAAVLSGLPTGSILFVGFLPREGKQRRELLMALAKEAHTVIVYESPKRVHATLSELYSLWGDRPAALMRELTKIHEETLRGTLFSLSELTEKEEPRGECVLAVGGADPEKAKAGATEDEVDAMLQKLISGGMRVKDAAKQVSAVLDVPRNEVYERALHLRS
jgi:16S rRNA (cytidine1402-2'-O)-methyltransferase